MALSKIIHKDGTATIFLTIAGVVHAIPASEWSRLLATATVVDE